MLFDRRLLRRAEEAENAVAIAQAQLANLERMIREQTTLVSITKHDARTVRFIFTRNGELTPVSVYASLDLDVNGLRAALIDPLP